jgi:glucosamine--fructose-6-phosphate aminotransferase (isomerizing)
MCGIIAVVRRRTERTPPTADQLLELLAPVPGLLAERALDRTIADAADRVAGTDRLLRGVPGARALVADRALLARLENLLSGLDAQVLDVEHRLDVDPTIGGPDLEQVNADLVRLKDALWAVHHDRLGTASAVAELAGPVARAGAVAAYTSIHQALAAIDRLEVRGRDSAGLHVSLRDHGLDLDSPAIRAVIDERVLDPLFRSGAVRTPNGHLTFVYKAAAEIGELGDNTRELRRQIAADSLLAQALDSPSVEAVVLGHTRWASVGMISQANAHPLNAEESDGVERPHVVAVLNGDVDNFGDLRATEGLQIPDEIDTDAKVIPTLTARELARGVDLTEAFRSTVNQLEGSVAIAACSADAPGDLLLALRGSGQALYVGLAEDAYIVASEPYGVVEETDVYVRMDGETPSDPAVPASRGQVMRLRGAAAGTLDGIERWSYDGSLLPPHEDEIVTAQITTRDIDRGRFPHYLLKEISEAPDSFRKTLRGKLVDTERGLDVRLPPQALPASVAERLRRREIRRVYVIGQGTAAVAGQSLRVALEAAMGGDSLLQVTPMLATELSGFALRNDMSDSLVVAISQSGTTTDTNRTVDVVRARGAAVLAIVNRRNSDLTDRADGVLYTSDGRDVEMAVASTKAFYSQIAACFLLAYAIADVLEVPAAPDRADVLAALRGLPDAMAQTLELRPHVADAAQRFAPSRRYWAVVGNGVNRIAAHEVRIKLSELCYKSISCDSTEDKKHIDLSCEPLIVVCASGLSGSTADDVAKEIAIYRAHRAAPIVVATEGDERYAAAFAALLVPPTHPALAFVLSAMVGHVFGYEAALAIDAQARPLRRARAALESAIGEWEIAEIQPDDLYDLLENAMAEILRGGDEHHAAGRSFAESLRSGVLDGHLEASTAVRLASLFRFADGSVGLDSYQGQFGRVGTPSVLIEDLLAALSRAIEELTRPIDAIKHQAKTVTVGISRSDETLLQVPLVKEVLSTGVARDSLTYSSLRALGALEPLVESVLGYTRYAIEGRSDGDSTIAVVDRGGVGLTLRSRTEDNPVLRGTKHRVANERQVLLARGRIDGRTFILVPEVREDETTGLSLLHVQLADSLSLSTLRSVLRGYRGRYQALKDAVTETEPTFRDDLIATIPIVELMTEPIYDLAEHWRA